jgi:hypothetical protein
MQHLGRHFAEPPTSMQLLGRLNLGARCIRFVVLLVRNVAKQCAPWIPGRTLAQSDGRVV